ncbi:MAG: hypothetical protein PHY08_09065 [Candidatus Cloacimonetes bacterium]|nr:hypothetical protein [Candidatus Cloacimonadota bacterium]
MFKQFRDIKRGEFIVVGGDTASGCGDNSCSQFLSKTYLDVPLVFCSPVVGTEMTLKSVPVLEKIYDITGIRPLVAYERRDIGVSEMDRLAALNRKRKYEIFRMPEEGSVNNEVTDKLGWDTNKASRPAMLTALHSYIKNKLLIIYDVETINEMFSFIVTQHSYERKAQAEKNSNDDRVMALAIAVKLLEFSPDLTEIEKTEQVIVKRIQPEATGYEFQGRKY